MFCDTLSFTLPSFPFLRISSTAHDSWIPFLRIPSSYGPTVPRLMSLTLWPQRSRGCTCRAPFTARAKAVCPCPCKSVSSACASSGAWVGSSVACVVERMPTAAPSHTRRVSRQIWSNSHACSCFHRFTVQIDWFIDKIDRFISNFDQFINPNHFLNLSILKFKIKPSFYWFYGFSQFLVNSVETDF
jgi:hypothetical protein